MKNKSTITFLTYAGSRVEMLRRQGRKATSYNYVKLCRSLERFLGSRSASLRLDEITEDLVSDYERYLKSRSTCQASVSFYNRVFRSIYNQAVRDGLIKNTHPFDCADTRVLARRRTLPVDLDGTGLDIENLTKPEIIRQYRILAEKHNCLIKSITEIVHIS